MGIFGSRDPHEGKIVMKESHEYGRGSVGIVGYGDQQRIEVGILHGVDAGLHRVGVVVEKLEAVRGAGFVIGQWDKHVDAGGIALSGAQAIVGGELAENEIAAESGGLPGSEWLGEGEDALGGDFAVGQGAAGAFTSLRAGKILVLGAKSGEIVAMRAVFHAYEGHGAKDGNKEESSGDFGPEGAELRKSRNEGGVKDHEQRPDNAECDGDVEGH